jgi:hypothetical protein
MIGLFGMMKILAVEQANERVAPTMSPLSPAMAFASVIETGCEQFEVLQSLVANKYKIVSDHVAGSEFEKPATEPNDIRRKHKALRAQGELMKAQACIMMSLAKSFVANIIRARRICEHGAQHLRVGRLERKRFLSATEALVSVRNVNEHGHDVDGNKISPALHYTNRGFLDETSLYIGGTDEILMGPLNLYRVYCSAARMRELAGLCRPVLQTGGR